MAPRKPARTLPWESILALTVASECVLPQWEVSEQRHDEGSYQRPLHEKLMSQTWPLMPAPKPAEKLRYGEYEVRVTL